MRQHVEACFAALDGRLTQALAAADSLVESARDALPVRCVRAQPAFAQRHRKSPRATGVASVRRLITAAPCTGCATGDAGQVKLVDAVESIGQIAARGAQSLVAGVKASLRRTATARRSAP